MVERIVLLPQAVQDVAEAFDWYEERRPGLGLEFVGCVEAAIESVRQYPERHSCIFKNYRRAKLKRFPYVLFYDYAENVVNVYSVFHCSRDPRVWQDRLA